MLKPVELKIELFCRGMRLDRTWFSDPDSHRINRLRAGLGSGLELTIGGASRPMWVNVPVLEPFAHSSPFVLQQRQDITTILDTRDGCEYAVAVPPMPDWYTRSTTSGVEMRRIGVMQGNYLGIYVSTRCAYWAKPLLACKFCTTGVNVGVTEEWTKRVEDVVEVARVARQESGAIFTHFNAGYHYEEMPDREASHGLRQCEPYVRAVRREVGGFIGVQAVPVPRGSYHEYRALIEAGTDHFSFCYEFEDPRVFEEICPGKARTLGQRAFFDAMEYTSRHLGKGRVSGEIIAGIESIEATKRGIDRIVNAGAFPTVCIFRPTIGSRMANVAPPDPAAMKEVFAYLYEACRRAAIPVGVLPIEVSIVVTPHEAAALAKHSVANAFYGLRNSTLRQLARPWVRWRMRNERSGANADPGSHRFQ